MEFFHLPVPLAGESKVNFGVYQQISGLNGDYVRVVVEDWWRVLCTTVLPPISHHVGISLIERGASVFLTVLKIIPLGFLNTLVYRNTSTVTMQQSHENILF